MSVDDGSTSAMFPALHKTRTRTILKQPSDLSPLHRARTREDRKKAVSFPDGKAGLPLYEVRLVERLEAEVQPRSSCCTIF